MFCIYSKELCQSCHIPPCVQGGFQMFVSIYDEDDINNDDHVDDLYAQESLSPGQSISEVRGGIYIHCIVIP